MTQVRFAPVALLGGLACGVGVVAVYQWWWGLGLGIAVTVLTAVATPRGWGTRLPFAAGDLVAVAASAVPRGEGDYLVVATASGFTVVGLSLVLLGFSIGTLPRPSRPGRPGRPGPPGATSADTPPPSPEAPAAM